MEHIGKRIVVAGIVFACLGVTGLCPADTIYFKNGRKMEGEVKRTPDGLWIEGGLFEEEEIERIEKSPSVVKEKDDRPWYNGILNKVGIKTEEENQRDTKPPSRNVSRAPQVSGAANPAVQPGGMPVAPMGLPFLAPQAQQPGYGQDFSAMIEHAQQLQDQAQQRQMMMQEMMEAEEGGYDEPAPGSGASGGRKSPSSADSYDYRPQEYQKKGQANGDYDDDGTKKKTGGKRFKTMQIDEYGNVSWE